MEGTATESRTVSLKMPLDMWEELERLSLIADRTPSAEIRLAVRRWVDPEAVRDRNGGK